MDAIISVDESQQILLFNGAAERLFLCSAQDAIGQHISNFMPEAARTAHHGHIMEFSRSEEAQRRMAGPRDIMGLRADGTEFPIEAAISQVLVNGQKLSHCHLARYQ